MDYNSNEEEDTRNVGDKRQYTRVDETENFAENDQFQSLSNQKKYLNPSVPKIQPKFSSNNKSETLREALVRDIGENMSDLDIDFISKFIAVSGTTISYAGTKEEQDANFNKLIDSMIHQFPHLGVKLSAVQLNYTLNHLIKSMNSEK